MIPSDVRQRLREKHGIAEVQPLAPGMSGALVFRCSGQPTRVLRRWPLNTTTARVREIHQQLVALSQRVDWIPKLIHIGFGRETFLLDASGGIWELASWMPGRPVSEDAPVETIGRGAASIAMTHDALLASGCWMNPAPAIVERLERLRQLRDALPVCFRGSLSGRVPPDVVNPLSTAINELQRFWPESLHHFETRLTPWSRTAVPVQYVLRDVHREHILFEGGRVRGIIDFDAMRIDTPATDLARWATSFQAFRQDPDGTLDRVVADYFQNRTFHTSSGGERISPPRGSEFRTLLTTLAEVSLWISLANWVVWLVNESRQFPDFQLVSQRIRRLTESVQAIASR